MLNEQEIVLPEGLLTLQLLKPGNESNSCILINVYIKPLNKSL